MEEIVIDAIHYVQWVIKADVPLLAAIVPAIPIATRAYKNRTIQKAAKAVYRWAKFW